MLCQLNRSFHSNTNQMRMKIIKDPFAKAESDRPRLYRLFELGHCCAFPSTDFEFAAFEVLPSSFPFLIKRVAGKSYENTKHDRVTELRCPYVVRIEKQIGFHYLSSSSKFDVFSLLLSKVGKNSTYFVQFN